MRKICVVTATRAEYGVLRNLIESILADKELELCLVATGAHLSEKFGYTIQEIIEDGFPVEEKIPILSERDDEIGITNSMGKATILFGEMFKKQRPEMLVVVGDRYELLPICQSALIFGIPITHISGGEVTQGSIDDVVRHCITKMSQLHFPGCETYRKRIIQMGEEPERVFNYGDIGIENIQKTNFLNRDELEKSIGFSMKKPYACVTFHPATAENHTAQEQIKELLCALEHFPDMQFIITKANADIDGSVINDCIDTFVKANMNSKAFLSLGIKKYLSALKYCEMVIGNSSSGIIEVPCFGIPTVNIGERQKGRLQANSILNCNPITEDIVKAIKKARTEEFKMIARNAINPYGKGEVSMHILEEIKNYLKSSHKLKRFYDIQF